VSPVIVRLAIELLAGRQVTDVEELYGMLGGESRPDRMPTAIRRGVRELLHVLGYEQRWVLDLDAVSCSFRWVRGPWPADVEALRGRETVTFTNFD
jgi:hypothetical protein